jgi:hypothetical protein
LASDKSLPEQERRRLARTATPGWRFEKEGEGDGDDEE